MLPCEIFAYGFNIIVTLPIAHFSTNVHCMVMNAVPANVAAAADVAL
jgi:hypothetical protein